MRSMTQNIKVAEKITDNMMWPFREIRKQKQFGTIAVFSGLGCISIYIIKPYLDPLSIIGIILMVIGLIYFSEAIGNATV